MIIKKLVICILICGAYQAAEAQNPIVKDFGMADPHIYIFNEKAYLFSTRDADSTAHDFIMPDWHIWSSDDLINWNHEHEIKPSENYMGKGSTKCWATETVAKNGKYYFYFSNGNESIGVMVADKPEGPYKDVLGKPLLNAELTLGMEYDPTVLIEDDGTAYICFGLHAAKNENMRYYIAKLSEDMISLQEKPKTIVLNKEGGFYNDKPNIHKFNRKYYLSAGSLYAMSDTIYGPYDYVGNSGNDNYGLTRQAHGNYFTWKNQWFHTWCKFHLDPNIKFRESYITYLHYKDNGEMVDDTSFLDKHFATGVGRYDANWVKIESEWFMRAEKVNKAESPNGGFEIQKIQNGGTLYFPNMANLSDKKIIQFYVSTSKKGRIEIRDKNETGNILGICDVTNTGGFKSYNLLSCDLDDLKNVNDICFVFKGKSTDILHLDWFSFK